jgi:DNA primase catalytic core
MARIPDDELERLKRETDLVALVQAAGVQLRRHGANLVGRCPFHEDRSPSLVVTPAKHLWNCLGACQAGGSVIDWVMRTERVSFRHAVERLRTRAGAPVSAASGSEAPTLPPVAAVDMDDAALARAVIDFYHATLKESSEAIAYLERRGLNSVELIDRFHLGYANRTLGYRLPHKALKAGADVRGRLQRLGLMRESGHEHLRGSLVVPVFGERGQVVQCYGRKLRDDLREGTPLHLYLPGPHAGVWNLDALAGSKEIILCEALLDAMTFWVAGHRHVLTSYGVSGFTEAHRAALRLYGTERVLIAYDADEAGERAAERVADELTRMGIECYRVNFPRGLDANAYALTHTPASESLAGLLRGATWLGRPAPLVQSASVERASGATAAPSSSLAAALPAQARTATAPDVVASPAPSAPSPALTIERRGDDVHGTIADRSYRVRGLAKNLSPDALRVNLLATRGDGESAGVHVDTLDLYAARARGLFVAQAARELGVSEDVIKRDVGAVILALESLVAEQIARTLTPAAPVVPTMTEADRAAALELLRDPHLLDRILADFERAGVVGEETNKLVGYLAAVSRKLAEPLAVIIQSASAAGKTALMDAVLAFVPPEERVQYSAMTGQALFYMAETNLKHKVLAVVEEEGAERASYALKLLQSEGELTIASTGKDPDTGKLVTHEYRVEGPVMIMLTTTAVELDEELVNRALVLTVDEDREQTRAIHQRQRARRTLDGLLATVARTEVLTLHRNAQRLLEPVHVVNPYAPRLTFLDARTRTRRDHEKYLTLIDTVAFLHQHQRERKSIDRGGRSLAYIEVTLDDIAIANRLADAVLGRSLDELPPQARKLLALLTRMVAEIAARERVEACTIHFSRRQVREYTGWTDFQVRVHLAKLEALEYVLAHRGTRGQLYIYELLYQGEGDGEPGEPQPRFLMGLLDVDRLRNPRDYDPDLEGSASDVEPSLMENEHRPSPDRAPDVPRVSDRPIAVTAVPPRDLPPTVALVPKHASRNGTHAPRRTVAPGTRL